MSHFHVSYARFSRSLELQHFDCKKQLKNHLDANLGVDLHTANPPLQSLCHGVPKNWVYLRSTIPSHIRILAVALRIVCEPIQPRSIQSVFSMLFGPSEQWKQSESLSSISGPRDKYGHNVTLYGQIGLLHFGLRWTLSQIQPVSLFSHKNYASPTRQQIK